MRERTRKGNWIGSRGRFYFSRFLACFAGNRFIRAEFCSFCLRACLKSRYWRAAGSCRPGMRGPASLHSPVFRQALNRKRADERQAFHADSGLRSMGDLGRKKFPEPGGRAASRTGTSYRGRTLKPAESCLQQRTGPWGNILRSRAMRSIGTGDGCFSPIGECVAKARPRLVMVTFSPARSHFETGQNDFSKRPRMRFS